MKGLDIFRKIRDDVETSTWVGGIYSLIAFLAGFLLIWIEISNHMSASWVKEFRVDDNDFHQKMPIALELRVKQVPCYLLSIYIEDEVEHRLKPDSANYTRVDANGVALAAQKYPEEENGNYRGSETEKNDLLGSIDRKEGCRIQMKTKVDKVPGKVSIGFSDMRDRYIEITGQRPHESLNLDYVLEHIDFGDHSPGIKGFKQFNGEPLNYEPYLGLAPGDGTKLRSYTSFFKIVPTKFIHAEGAVMNTMQFAQSFRDLEVLPYQNPAITFKYEVSPITMIFRVQWSNSYNLIVQLCAVVGGIFALMGILNTATWESFAMIKKMMSEQRE